MPDETRDRLLSLKEPQSVCGVSVQKELNDLVLPHLLRTHGERTGDLWTKGTYYYTPLQEVREYTLDLQNSAPGADYIPTDASIYVDQDGVVLHHKVTGVITVSR